MHFEKRETVTLKCRDISQFGMLHIPIGKGPFPTVIICHGFMGDHIGRQGLYVELATRLSKLKIATLRMDFIGCGNSEGAIKKESIYSQMSQVLNQVAFIEKDERLNHLSLGLIGNSLGAVVSCLAISQIENIKCLSITGAIAKGSLWLSEWEKGNLGKNARDEFFYNDETYKEFASMKPVHAINSKEGFPSLIIHGKEDDIVSRNHFDLYCEYANPESKTMLLDNVGHYFGVGYQRSIYLDEVTKWTDKHLNPRG